MPSTVALLTLPGSPLGEALRPRIAARGCDCRILDLDAPLIGKPVTVRPDRVIWEGVALSEAGAILVERPVFPWPQPVAIDAIPPGIEEQQDALAAEREARALIVSALRSAAETVPVVNPPEACHFAAAPAAALDRAARAGLAVVPWRLEPAGAGDALVLDVIGNERWHVPATPESGQPALVLEAPPGPVTTVLVAGDSAAVAVRHDSARAWAASPAAGVPDDGVEAHDGETAIQAARSCALSLAAVTLAPGPSPALIAVDAAPDLAAWGRVTDGRALDAVAGHLLHLAHRQEARS